MPDPVTVHLVGGSRDGDELRLVQPPMALRFPHQTPTTVRIGGDDVEACWLSCEREVFYRYRHDKPNGSRVYQIDIDPASEK